jgi:hypothetical protein
MRHRAAHDEAARFEHHAGNLVDLGAGKGLDQASSTARRKARWIHQAAW